MPKFESYEASDPIKEEMEKIRGEVIIKVIDNSGGKTFTLDSDHPSEATVTVDKQHVRHSQVPNFIWAYVPGHKNATPISQNRILASPEGLAMVREVLKNDYPDVSTAVKDKLIDEILANMYKG